MPNSKAYQDVADELRNRLGRNAFVTLTRLDVTGILRDVSGEPNTRLKNLGSAAITEALARRGLMLYPDLYWSEGNQALRLFRTESFIAELVNILNNPGEQTDKRLRAALRGRPDDSEPELAPVPVAV